VKRDAGSLIVPLVAIVIFAAVTVQTVGALKASGAWSMSLGGRHRAPIASVDDPFTPIDQLLGKKQPSVDVARLRDPFMLGGAPVAVAIRTAPVHHAPPPPPRPVLTAIVWDADPRAVVRWNGRDWTVHSGGLFDEFQVVSITRSQVTLSKGGETIVLQRRTSGD